MTLKLVDRLSRLEGSQRAANAIVEPIPPMICENALRTISARFGGYPCGPADTLADGLARALQYGGRNEADADASEDPTRIHVRVDALWPRVVEAFDPTQQSGSDRPGHDRAFRVWVGLLDYRGHYRTDDKPTADARHLPNGLPLFDYAAPSVRAAFGFFKVNAEAVEASHER